MKFFLLLVFVFGVNAQYGPGRGSWVVGRPEDYGLSESALAAAEVAVNSAIAGRTCYLVIKEGVIVYERYRGSGGVNVRRDAWSCTKSMCGSLYGIAVEQGWADVSDRIADRNSGTRQCNNDARFEHALTMTGTSSNINNPRFSYDTFGTACLDSLSDFIDQNNPERLTANNWKNRFWHDILGLESMQWGGNNLACGFGATTTCRDLARVAQLYINDGAWPGAGQVMNKEYTQKSRTWIFPTSGTNYGYTVWRQGASDPVDPNTSRMDGMYTQCAIMSKQHEAIIVSMGQALSGAGCTGIWTSSRNAIVSKAVRHLYNTTSEEEDFQEAIGQNNNSIPDEEILAMGKYMLANQDEFAEDDINSYKEWFEERY